MKRNLPKAIRRVDWQNYLDPEDQKRIKDERTYRISSRLDVVVDAKGEIALILHQGHEYLANTWLPLGRFGVNRAAPWKPIPSSLFIRFKKKQFPKFYEYLDQQVKLLLEKPLSGEAKKGPLKGIRAHKFRFQNQLYLLSYEPAFKTRELLLYTFGVHEKFYEHLERCKK